MIKKILISLLFVLITVRCKNSKSNVSKEKLVLNRHIKVFNKKIKDSLVGDWWLILEKH